MIQNALEFIPEFLKTPAMKNNNWKKPMFKNRHAVCRFAMHGFHNQICNKSGEKVQCLNASDYCVCVLCGEPSITWPSALID